ncbi:MAG: hypothetical protein ACRDKF_03040 [Actinomycetota bacterium]
MSSTTTPSITGRRDLRVDVHGWDTEAPLIEVTIESLWVPG